MSSNNPINPNGPNGTGYTYPTGYTPQYYSNPTGYPADPNLLLLQQQLAQGLFNGQSNSYYPQPDYGGAQSQGYFAQFFSWLLQYFPFLQSIVPGAGASQPGLPSPAQSPFPFAADPNALAPGEKALQVDGNGNFIIEGTSAADQIFFGSDARGTFVSVNGDIYRVRPADVQKLKDGAQFVIKGNGGDDLIDASGAGAEKLLFNRIEIRGGEGNDTIIGSEYADRIFGEQGRDTIKAGGGNDRVSGGDGVDNVQLGSGDDFAYEMNNYGSGQEGDVYNGGDGNDRIEVSGRRTGGVTFQELEFSQDHITEDKT